MQFRLLIAGMAAALALSACATEAGYRQRMDLLQGASTDAILIDWGPPQSRTAMSDGRELWSYARTSVDESAGYWRDETREVTRTYRDRDGVEKTETISETFPVWQPPQTYRATCNTRFVMASGRVETVAFDGDGCIAEEIQ
jgi:hypothetical protein